MTPLLALRFCMNSPSPPTPEPQRFLDLELVGRVLQADSSAQAEFAQRMECIPRLLFVRNSQLGHPVSTQDLPDLVQQVVLIVWSKLETFEGRSVLETWIYRICSLELMNAARRRRTRTGGNDSLDELEAPAASAPEAWDLQADLHYGLSRLKDSGHEVVRLKHYEGLSFVEIANRIGGSTSLAKARYYEAIQRLRELMSMDRSQVGP